MSKRLDGRVAIVTGAAAGMGAAVVRLFTEHGAQIAAVDLPNRKLREIYASQPNVMTIEKDVADPDAPDVIVTAVERVFGRLDVLVNNAGITHTASVTDCTDEDWKRVLDVDLTAVFRLTRAAVPLLKKSKAGRVINTGSVWSTFTAEGKVAYTAAKHGVLGLTRTFAVELGRHGITVNCIQPGAILTELSRPYFDANESARELWAAKAALGRLGEPEDVAPVTLFLASDDARWITGAGILVDGGSTLAV